MVSYRPPDDQSGVLPVRRSPPFSAFALHLPPVWAIFLPVQDMETHLWHT